VRNQSPDTLRRTPRGPPIERGDAAYDDARKVGNGMVDTCALAITGCAAVADVIEAVRLGREEGLLLAIRGGGHNERCGGRACAVIRPN
jgi:hypothetical protein